MTDLPDDAPDPADPSEPGRAAGSGRREIPRRPRRVVRRGTETSAVDGASGDERGTWGESGPVDGSGANDERLRRDVPPHW
ncbi:hypothetical protein [Oerskovia flava]|uniref:hypothetical protein n=1 Tax=Oerskovia flava TaxID=2986422 RepID=UPI00223FD56E|nr:hypothetical protein [Oerskovia sp. JB1-3-2]